MNLPSFLTVEQKADIKQSLRDTELRKQMNYHREQDLKHYGSPEPEPVVPKTLVYNYADSKEVRATIEHLEKRVNELDGFKKMAHTHSKKVSKEDRY